MKQGACLISQGAWFWCALYLGELVQHVFQLGLVRAGQGRGRRLAPWRSVKWAGRV